MKKGDLRKQEILNTAEILFCRKGYEETSIQDILDQLNSSKGSFYHHFISKEAVLEGICKKRAGQIFEAAAGSVIPNSSATEQLDIYLSGMIPLKDEKLSFLMMILPVFTLPEGRMIRQSFCDSLAEQFHPAVYNLLKRGNQDGEMICGMPDIAADVVLYNVNRLWVKIYTLIINAEVQSTSADLSELLRITDCYRQSLERMLFLQYGSLKLVDIQMLRQLTEQVHNHWKD